MPENKLHEYIIEELNSLHKIIKTQPEFERASVILDCLLHDIKCSDECDMRKDFETLDSAQ
jgi:hypothetical protein